MGETGRNLKHRPPALAGGRDERSEHAGGRLTWEDGRKNRLTVGGTEWIVRCELEALSGGSCRGTVSGGTVFGEATIGFGLGEIFAAELDTFIQRDRGDLSFVEC